MKRSRSVRASGHRNRLPQPCAWIAEARISARGGPLRHGQKPALLLFSVSVHRDFPANIRDRLSLLGEVRYRFARKVPAGTSSLWVFPGGYLGFDASANMWHHFNRGVYREIEVSVLRALSRFPVHATVALGVDSRRGPTPDSDVRQQAWVTQRHPDGCSIAKVTRGESTIRARQFSVGPLKAAFFVCGEFTGSRTEQNGPFFCDSNGNESFLTDPVAQLRDCHLLVDLAHQEVSGSLSGVCSPRMVHRLQMKRFSRRGDAVLSHHHSGLLTDGRPHFKHQSNWVVFRGGQWLDASRVRPM